MCIPTLENQEVFLETEEDDLFSDAISDRIGTYDNDIDISVIEESVTENCNELCKRKFNIDFNTLIDEAKMREYVYAIISITGDDEIIATNAIIIAILHFICAKEISGIELSEKDTGISSRKGNYAEGWILLPPNREASVDAVARRHQGSGIPLVMDGQKLKQVSAVRKQSKLETDFESKYTDLFKSADWVDESWITYDYSQLCMIYATCIFDFRSSNNSPFLSKTEGGCGGKPPWNNIDTAFAGIEYMGSGRHTQSVLWIMTEATSIQRGRLKPANAKFINASHYAQTDSKALSKLKDLHEKLEKLSAEEKLTLLESTKIENTIPPELKEKSVAVEPADKLLGCAISELRKNGLIMTELDVHNQIAKQRKYDALLGDVNMGVVIEEANNALKESKRNAFRILASMGRGSDVPEITDFRKIMVEYYRMKADYSDITALSYAGELRVFKSSDVLEYYESQSGSLRDEIAAGMKAANSYGLSQKLSHEKRKLEYQIEWMKGGEISELLEGEIPRHVGSDDARIVRKLSLQIPLLEEETVFVIFSDDRGMFESIVKLFEKRPLAKFLQVGKKQFLESCMEDHPPSRGKVNTLNIATNKPMAIKDLRSRINELGTSSRFGKLDLAYQLIWDFPNYERKLENIRFVNKKDRRTGMLHKRYVANENGYLKRSTLSNMKYWTSLPWDKFKEIEDFTINEREVIIHQERRRSLRRNRRMSGDSVWT